LNIKSIAEEAGVSVATVSRVLNHPDVVSPKTREGVLAVVDRMDYTPNLLARGLKLKKTDVIALLLPELRDFNYMEIAQGVEDVAHQKGYVMMLCTMEDDRTKEKEYIENLMTRQVDGMILAFSNLTKQDLLSVKKKQIATVFIGRNSELADENVVYVDYCAATVEVIRHMADIGHKTIGMIVGEKPRQENREKLLGFQKGLQEMGLDYHEALVIEAANNAEGGYLAVSQFLNRGQRPDAIFVTSDMMAIGAMEKIKQSELSIPKDIAIVGFDNLKISAFVEPKLTTVVNPAYCMGLVAARLLFNTMEEGEGQEAQVQEILIQSKLKVRKSCGYMGRLKEIHKKT